MGFVIPDDELDRLREDALDLFPTEARVLNRVEAQSGGGSIRKTWEAGSLIPARIAPAAGRGQGAGDRIDEETSHIVTLPAYTEIGEEDAVEIDDVAYKVTAVRRRTDDEIVRRVEVTEAAPGEIPLGS